MDKGEILIHGKKVHIQLPKDAIQNGIGLIPEDRKLQGCFLEKQIRWNISISNIRELSSRFIIDGKKETTQANTYKSLLNIKTPSLEQMTKNLSGGNQQKVPSKIGLWLIQFMIKTPCQCQAQHLCLARAGCHLHNKTPP